MPQPSKIPLAFAASGDKNAIPESTETTGLASWREGFPAITSTPFSEGGIAPKRADFNGIFNALSQAVMWMQQGGVYVYDADTDYEAGNVVLDAGGLYVANAGNGPSSVVVQPSTDTTGVTWKLLRLDLATQSSAGYMSATDKVKLDGLENATFDADTWKVIKDPSGWMCQSSTQNLTVNSSGLVTVTFAEGFSTDQPQIAVLGRSSAHIYRIQGLSLSSVSLQVYTMTGESVTSGTSQFCLIAMGRWK